MHGQREPRDYQLGRHTYDARVLAANTWYLNLQLEEPLVFGLSDEVDALIEQELAELREVFEARAQDVHQLAWWHRVRRPVCTCGLAIGDLEQLDDPAGHLDPHRWTPAATVVVKVDDGESVYVAGCQACREHTRTDDPAAARGWTHGHTCGG